jgi:hypothetical protein
MFEQELQVLGPQVNVGALMNRVQDIMEQSAQDGKPQQHGNMEGNVNVNVVAPRGSDFVDPYKAVMNDDDSSHDVRQHHHHHYRGTSPPRRPQQPQQHQDSTMLEADLSPHHVDPEDAALLNAVDLLAATTIARFVPERLFRAIFNKYLNDNSPVMNLTR